jgi:hypothetical protein
MTASAPKQPVVYGWTDSKLGRVVSGKTFVIAMVASAIVSIAILLLRIVVVSGSWPEYVTSPEYLVVAAKAYGWYFLVGLLASSLTLFFALKNRD